MDFWSFAEEFKTEKEKVENISNELNQIKDYFENSFSTLKYVSEFDRNHFLKGAERLMTIINHSIEEVISEFEKALIQAKEEYEIINHEFYILENISENVEGLVTVKPNVKNLTIMKQKCKHSHELLEVLKLYEYYTDHEKRQIEYKFPSFGVDMEELINGDASLYKVVRNEMVKVICMNLQKFTEE